jgi:hypothetical protein
MRRDNSQHIDPKHKRYRNPVTMATDLRRKESKNVLEQLWRNSAKVACLDGEVRIHFSLGNQWHPDCGVAQAPGVSI